MSISNNSTDAVTRESDLAAAAVETVRRWLAESATVVPGQSALRLAGVLKDPRGLEFTAGFVDRVVRPENLRVAGRNLDALSRQIPDSLPLSLKIAIQLAGGFAPLLPWPIVPIARRILRRLVSHLILDATPSELDRSLRELRTPGIRVNLAMLGEAVISNAEADRRLAATRELLARHDVDHVSIAVSSVTNQLNLWAFDETVTRVVERLTPLFEEAARSATRKFITLDMHEFRDLDLTIEVFRRILEQPKLKKLEAGIVLQAYLPDSFRAMQGLTAWATKRRVAGGAGIKVRLVKGAYLALEQVDAVMHGWPLATFSSKLETDTNYKRILDWSLTPERTDAVRIGVAGHNMFDLAHAWLLAKERRVDARVEFEMFLGMATGQADVVNRDVGGLTLFTPVVHTGEFNSALPYLIRRLGESAGSEDFLSGVFDIGHDPAVFDREAEGFLASIAALATSRQVAMQVALDGQSVADVPPSHRTQDRRIAPPSSAVDTAPRPFANEPNTDPSLAANRVWAREILGRITASRLGIDAVAAARVIDASALEIIVHRTIAAGSSWGERRADTRATVLHSAGESLAAARAELIEVMASETGKTIAEGDVEVSAAVDFAHFYAESARELDRISDAEFVPSRLTIVTPAWNFPVGSAAGSVLAALAAGSAVIIAPAPQARRSAAVLVAALQAGGVPRDVLAIVTIDDGPLYEQLVTHGGVDRVIVTGASEWAAGSGSSNAEPPVRHEPNAKNAIIVTPSADLDLAVADIVTSAFGHAGQKHSAASLVILVGSVATSARFARQLIDAVTSLRVGFPLDATTDIGPLIEPASAELLLALTTLAPGESWLVRPRLVDSSGVDSGTVDSGTVDLGAVDPGVAATGKLWSPGIRDGVAADSVFHLTNYFAPVLGIMRAANLSEAIALQNAPQGGLTAGIHSLDAAEIALWIDSVDAGNLYVNRATTGAIVRRQPFGGGKRTGGGKRAAVDSRTKIGGPNYLLTLGRWRPVFAEPGQSVKIRGISEPVIRLIEAAQPGMGFLEFDRVRAGARSDETAWQNEYGVASDVSQLGIERNVLRYLPVAVAIRLSEGASSAQLVRLLAAAARAGAPVSISSAVPVAAELIRLFASDASPLRVTEVVVESDAAWHLRCAQNEQPADRRADQAAGLQLFEAAVPMPRRIRLIEGDASALANARANVPSAESDFVVYDAEVTTSGRLELLTFLQEQSISITAHRFGNADPSTFVAL